MFYTFFKQNKQNIEYCLNNVFKTLGFELFGGNLKCSYLGGLGINACLIPVQVFTEIGDEDTYIIHTLKYTKNSH